MFDFERMGVSNSVNYKQKRKMKKAQKNKTIEISFALIFAIIVAIISTVALSYIVKQEKHVTMACTYIENGDSETAIQYIEDNVNDVDLKGSNRKTLLIVACEKGDVDVIRELISRGADLNYAPSGQLSPLETYCLSGYKNGHEGLDALLKAGARQSKYVEKPAIYILLESCQWNSKEEKDIATECAISLLKKGAPLGYKYTTILHEAAKYNLDGLFYTVVHTNEGLSMLNSLNADGSTPWETAIKHGAVGVQRVIRNLEIEYQEEQNKATEPSEDVNVPVADNDNNSEVGSDVTVDEYDSIETPSENLNNTEGETQNEQTNEE